MHYRDATPYASRNLLHAVNGHSMTNVPEGMGNRPVAMGCFWGVERLYWQLPGVYSTAAGYGRIYAKPHLPRSLLRRDRPC